MRLTEGNRSALLTGTRKELTIKKKKKPPVLRFARIRTEELNLPPCSGMLYVATFYYQDFSPPSPIIISTIFSFVLSTGKPTSY